MDQLRRGNAGHGDRAFAVYRKTCPAYIEDISEIHRTEPYVYSQMVAGKDAPTFGEAKNSWLTGTAAWTFFNISQYILGIQPTLDGLRVDPCIPHTLTGYTVTRRFRGAEYRITVDNAAGVQHGVKAVTVDARPSAAMCCRCCRRDRGNGAGNYGLNRLFCFLILFSFS